MLIGGGEGGGQALSDTELFDPARDQFAVAGALMAARTRIQGAVLTDEVVLGTGGQNADGPSDACGVFATSRLTFTKSQYASGETAVVNGSGFNAVAGKTITLSLTATGGDASAGFVVRDRLMTSSVLAALDADHDGEISAGEIQNSSAALKKIDKNLDGRLTPDELIPASVAVQAAMILSRLDANGDGRISARERGSEEAGPIARASGKRGSQSRRCHRARTAQRVTVP